jgi:hypothetical protein
MKFKEKCELAGAIAGSIESRTWARPAENRLKPNAAVNNGPAKLEYV